VHHVSASGISTFSRNTTYNVNFLKAKIHYTSFPVATTQQIGDSPIMSLTSL